ncbi:MAG: succinate-semialdehyde dehydrogenase / glutarate-semialdehyde dehydrogenase, partial [Acetobacteraceae bacterium]|nr:succinate-semialdehyde dehydrogenase / glutarate-semialdehyde dehydrogenase [Acetobacteraceae bacterium]
MSTQHSPVQLKDPTLLRHEAFIDGEWQAADDASSFE